MKFKIFFAALISFCSFNDLEAQFFCIPEAADIFSSKAMKEINTRHISWVKITATDIKSDKISVDDVQGLANSYAENLKIADSDIMAMVFLVMMEASKSAQEDMKAIMAGVKATNEQKKSLREAMTQLKKKKNEKKPLLRADYDSLKKVLATADLDSVKKTSPTEQQPAKPARTTPVSNTELNQLMDEYRDKLDSMNELGEMQSLRLQMVMDRINKLMSTLSNLFKKVSDTQTEIISNLK
ncbi:MAG: hypothetical protein SGI83_06175 [Bacteroidota bacterium]|nr:hypothetical protein [Bacteroidota bacterium]